jgi:hypothetical protein
VAESPAHSVGAITVVDPWRWLTRATSIGPWMARSGQWRARTVAARASARTRAVGDGAAEAAAVDSEQCELPAAAVEGRGIEVVESMENPWR